MPSNNHLMKKALVLPLILAAGLSHAGTTPAPGPIAITTPATTGQACTLHPGSNMMCATPYNGLSVGYDSKFLCRGMEMGDDLIWTRLNGAIPLAEGLTLGLGAWYGNSTDNGLQELDGLVNLQYDLNPVVTLGLNFKWYHYFDHGDSGMDMGMGSMGMGMHDMGMGMMEHDMGMGMMPMAKNYYDLGPSVTLHLGPIDLTSSYTYEFESEGHYFEVVASSEIKINDRFSLVPAVSVAYTKDWMVEGEGWNNVGLRLDAPIKVTDRVTLSPFIAANLPLEALDAHQDNVLFGGASLRVSF